MNEHSATIRTISSLKCSYDSQCIIALKMQSQDEEADNCWDMISVQITLKELKIIVHGLK